MSESRLDAAVRALRNSTDGRSDRADQTERAIVERLSRTRSRGSPRFSGLRLGLAFALLSSSVWALKGETGSRLLSWLGTVGAEKPIEDSAPKAPRPVSPSSKALPAAPAIAPTVEAVNAPRIEEPIAQKPNASLRQFKGPSESVRSRLREEAPVDPDLGDASLGSEEPLPIHPSKGSGPEGESMAIELRFYREAREAFVNGGEDARALGLWDRYLAEFPAGTFGPEARFSRAVCLMRLGQKSQAKLELELFANGSGYRKREAQELLSTLNGQSRVETAP